ncbi:MULTISPECIES: hypothetical protein [Rheinheimera]|uniref:Cell-division protein ZapC N-terminal domain-containing protein n=1 Tax=Rheinheimera marina TaxID=1774958 RepID=A0ABV9JJ85_9GAMM
MLFINPNWRWQFCPQQGTLQLCLDASTVLCSGLTQKQLRHCPVQQGDVAALTLEHAGLLMEQLEQLESLVPAELAMPCALRLMAIRHFAAAAVQKSHYFQFGTASRAMADYSLVLLAGQSPAKALLFACEGQTADCLLLESVHTLTGKELSALSHVRVLANRLSPFSSGSAYLLSA